MELQLATVNPGELHVEMGLKSLAVLVVATETF